MQIPDIFSGFQFVDYDTDYADQPITPVILTNQHVDIRIFDANGITRPRTMSDLDTDPMNTLDGLPMTELEEVVIVPGENYLLAGVGAIIDTTPDPTYGSVGVGKFAGYKGWRALRLRCSGVNLSGLTITSDWPGGSAGGQVDISQMDTFSILVDDSGLSGGSSISAATVQFNNDPNGLFGGATDSNIYSLTETTDNWTLAIATALASAGGCNFSNVTGIRFVFTTAVAPANNDLIYLLGCRAYKTGYDPATARIDLNTKRGSAIVPIPLNLSAPARPAQPMIRGSAANLGSDPRPLDATTRIHIKPGGLKFADTTNRLIASAYHREDRASSNLIKTNLEVYSGGARWRVNETVNGVAAASLAVNTILSGSTWTNFLAAYDYWVFEVVIKGSTVRMRLYGSDEGANLRAIIYDSTYLDIGLSKSRGRVGWGLDYSSQDRDFQFFGFDGFGLAFSSLITNPCASFSVVDGVQLIAAYSEDDNVFTDFSGVPTPTIDTQRTLSDDGSNRSTGPMASNVFTVQNTDQSYLDFDLWVPDQVSIGNQPRLVLRSPSGGGPDVFFTVLDLQGNQWNHVHVELGETKMLPGIIYQLFIERGEGTGTTYEWNVDNMVIGVRNVRWSACADGSGNFLDFRDTVNDAAGALHFPHDARGTQLQIQAEALTEKAWIAPFTFIPHYAELGKPKYLP